MGSPGGCVEVPGTIRPRSGEARGARHFEVLKNPALGFSFVPKVRDEGAFSVYVYSPPREHHPPHVHVEYTDGGEVLVRLGDDDTAPSLWQNHHMKAIHAREAVRIVQENQQQFLAEWRRLHGEAGPPE